MPRKEPARRQPRFASEDEERAFWAEHDVDEYFDWEHAARARLPNLKPTTTAISLRLPLPMLEELKSLAHERDVPYQSLLKLFLAERLERERALANPLARKPNSVKSVTNR
jgi:predicted DNA binding CopG/RHH family protein